jgi:NAD(P)-dependent dehydrogenase (short-subunit alcohol dehydrogenase family)
MGILEGKVAVITGAGNGIGRATALLFAKEGAKVVVNDLGCARDGAQADAAASDNVVLEIKAQGGSAVANYDSVATPEGAKNIVATATEHFGKLDIFVNNAGIIRDKTLLKLDVETWDSVIEVHLKGSFLCTQAAALVMKEQGGGSIINTTSVSGMLGNFGQSNYASAKAGIYGLTRTASIELQRYKIRVNAVAPIAKTRITEDLPLFTKIENTLSPEHVAPAHLFLASDLASDVTGTILAVAGARMSVYKVVESAGKFKESDNGIWTAEEIAEHFSVISKV